MYIEPYRPTCLNSHIYYYYNAVRYIAIFIRIHICFTHIDDVNRSLSYIMFNYVTRKYSDDRMIL